MPGFFEFLRKRSEQPIEERSYGGMYLLLSGLLFVGTMWSVVDEVSTRRPWKEYQAEYLTRSVEGWRARAEEERAAVDSAALAELRARYDSLRTVLESPELGQAMSEVDRLDHELVDATREATFAKSKGDETYYFWKKSIHDGAEDAGLRAATERHEADFAAANRLIDSLTARRTEVASGVDAVRAAQREVERGISDLLAPLTEAERRLEVASGSPILIRQVMMNGFDRSNFGTPKARIDRCQTCHAGWNDEMMEEAPQPFTTHPLPELLKTHNPEVFGCTPCHRGQGAALTAGFAHGEDDHYWEWPLLKGKEVYASCNSCHESELHLPQGGAFNKGKQILLESGCFGCHEVKGFADLPRIGPELRRLGEKLDPQWLYRWMKNPKEYNPHTRMPDFRFTPEQAASVTAYLLGLERGSASRPVRTAERISGGNPARGRELVETVGCKGCHVVGGDERLRQERGLSYDIAPELSRVGSKLDPAWMFAWLKNPRAYRPTTTMPNLRLTDQEAKDIVAYLVTQRDDRQFDRADLDLGSEAARTAGFSLVREYGCAGCHAIPGHENENKVSVSLSNFGRKRVDELDFGDTKVPHTWNDWFFGKLEDARQYATDRIASKMPVFALADSEIVMLRTVFRGMTKEIPEPEYRRAQDRILQNVEAGRRLAQQYNCIGCHQIEETGGSIRAVLEGEGMAPPYLRPEGSKVREDWLHDFLKQPSTIRPWLEVRMPTFGLTDGEITTLTNYFLGLHGQTLALRDYDAAPADPVYTAVGKKLFDDLQCLSCHTTGRIPEGKEAADLAPDLSMARSRLKPEWVDLWIAKPDSIQPGTRMPNFFPELDVPSYYSDDLGGDVWKQIRAMREYITTIRR